MIDWLSTVRFGTPWLLLALVVLPAWWVWRRNRRPPAIVFSRTDVLARGPKSGLFVTRALFVLRNLLVAGLIVAIARPRTGAHAENITTEGINIVLAIDLSSSMLSEDFQPQNRLEVAKDKVKQFIVGRRNDRIGLVAFAAEALTQVPLTVDYPVLLAAVDNLAGRAARGWHGNRHRDRDGGEPPAHGAGEIAGHHSPNGRRQQPRRHRPAHGGAGGGGDRRQDLHDRRRVGRHGAGARRARAHGLALRVSPGGDR